MSECSSSTFSLACKLQWNQVIIESEFIELSAGIFFERSLSLLGKCGLKKKAYKLEIVLKFHTRKAAGNLKLLQTSDKLIKRKIGNQTAESKTNDRKSSEFDHQTAIKSDLQDALLSTDSYRQ